MKTIFFWLNFRSVATETTPRQCAGHCQANSSNCNIFIFDDTENVCMLGTIGASYNLMTTQADMSSYIDTGMVFASTVKSLRLIKTPAWPPVLPVLGKVIVNLRSTEANQTLCEKFWQQYFLLDWFLLQIWPISLFNVFFTFYDNEKNILDHMASVQSSGWN